MRFVKLSSRYQLVLYAHKLSNRLSALFGFRAAFMSVFSADFRANEIQAGKGVSRQLVSHNRHFPLADNASCGFVARTKPHTRDSLLEDYFGINFAINYVKFFFSKRLGRNFRRRNIQKVTKTSFLFSRSFVSFHKTLLQALNWL